MAGRMFAPPRKGTQDAGLRAQPALRPAAAKVVPGAERASPAEGPRLQKNFLTAPVLPPSTVQASEEPPEADPLAPRIRFRAAPPNTGPPAHPEISFRARSPLAVNTSPEHLTPAANPIRERTAKPVIQALFIPYPDSTASETDLLSLPQLKAELIRVTAKHDAAADGLVKEAWQRSVSRLTGVINNRTEEKQVNALQAFLSGPFVTKHVATPASDEDFLKTAWAKCAARDTIFKNSVIALNGGALDLFRKSAMTAFEANGRADGNYRLTYKVLVAETSEDYPNRISIWKDCEAEVGIQAAGPNQAIVGHLESVPSGTRVATFRFHRNAAGVRILTNIETGLNVYLD